MVKYLKQRTNHKHIKNDYIHCLVPISAENRINYTNVFLAQNLTSVFSKRLQKTLKSCTTKSEETRIKMTI